MPRPRVAAALSATSPAATSHAAAALLGVLLLLNAGASVSFAQRPQQPPRDTPAGSGRGQGAASPAGTARITGHVLAADNGHPLSRARVFVTGSGVPGGRAALTAEDGSFEIKELPEGRYTLTAGKAGFVSLAYGQRRPFQPGTPLQLRAGQQLTGVDLRIPRGSVISGQVFDESGEPLPGVPVRALRQELSQGTPQLVPAGVGQTDDRGAYRIWGLNPGEYYIAASTPPPGLAGPGGRGVLAAAPIVQTFVSSAGATGGFAAAFVDSTPPGGAEPVGYAPTYYPGVGSEAEARPLTVGLSAEVSGINFSILLVRTARVSGRVIRADGSLATGGNVVLTPESAGRGGRLGVGGIYPARLDGNGTFIVNGVPPGRYVVRARGETGGQPEFAVQPLTIAGEDLRDLTVILAKAATISGSVSFGGADQSAQQPDIRQVRVAATSVELDLPGGGQAGRVADGGAFTIGGVQPGRHLVQAQGVPRGWTLESVQLDGRDVTDTPIDVRSGQALTGVVLTFTDRVTELNGTIADARGTPVTDYTVLAFSADAVRWQPPSRHIGTARPDQDGRFQIRGLPPGDYLVVPIDPGQPGEWLRADFLEAHRDQASRVSLTAGQVTTKNFTVAAP